MAANNLQKLRSRLKKQAEDAIENGSRNPLDFVPKIGKTNVRFLPPINEDELFYHTHAYHYFPHDGGKFVYTPRKFDVDGVQKEDPVDVAVKQWYALAEKSGDANIKQYASTLKRKRHFFFNVILLDEEDLAKKYRVLQDRSNDGKLAKLVCITMGLPFFRDVQDNWVDQASLEIDEEKDYFDLIDIEEGHDFKITMEKDGDNPWDITYAKSFAVKKSRALTTEELKLMETRVDLKNYVSYETNYNVLKQLLEDFLESVGSGSGTSDEDAETETPKEEKLPALNKDEKGEMKEVAKKALKKKASETEEEEMDQMLDELDD